jgi:(p)ppGpp synthase/HD superfamily hydrolase
MSIINTNRLCSRAAKFAAEKHKYQKRNYTREPYFNHCVEVAVTLEWAGEDEETICAGLLHDTIEDTPTTFFELVDVFGVDIATLVSEVTDIAPPTEGMNRAQRKEIERNHLRAASPRGKSVKLADIMSNTVSIAERDPGFAKVYLPEKKLLLPFLREGNPLLYERASAIVAKLITQLLPTKQAVLRA